MQIGKKQKREQTEVGGSFLQYLKRKFCVRVVGHELPWSRDARIPKRDINFVLFPHLFSYSTVLLPAVTLYTDDINLGQFYSVFTIFCHFST